MTVNNEIGVKQPIKDIGILYYQYKFTPLAVVKLSPHSCQCCGGFQVICVDPRTCSSTLTLLRLLERSPLMSATGKWIWCPSVPIRFMGPKVSRCAVLAYHVKYVFIIHTVCYCIRGWSFVRKAAAQSSDWAFAEWRRSGKGSAFRDRSHTPSCGPWSCLWDRSARDGGRPVKIHDQWYYSVQWV